MAHRSWTDEDLERAVRSSSRMSEVCRALGLKSGGNYPSLYKHIERLRIDTTHFQDIPVPSSHQLPLAVILVAGSTYENTSRLKGRLLRAGLLQKQCAVCGLGDTWHGSPIMLQLDHVDGDRRNHSIENLRLLCPNCHSQTITFTGRNKGWTKDRKM